MKPADLSKYCVTPDATVRTVLETINRNRDGIAFVVDAHMRLAGTLTDGDIRRFLLRDGTLQSPCLDVVTKHPVTVRPDTPREELVQLFHKFRIRQIPVVDAGGVVVGVINMQDILAEESSPAPTVVIMAGGLGTRLRPLTEQVPKPMLPVGDRPILERIVGNLRESGLRRIYVSVNYKAEVIEEHFGDGRRFGVEIRYIHEEQRMGTAGSLALLPEVGPGPIMVMNGDLVTSVNFANILDFHRQHRAALSVAASEYRIKIPYGVLQHVGHFVTGLEEKPEKVFYCNAGIYVLEPELRHFIPGDRLFNMTQLIEITMGKGLPVAVFPIHEYWVDIGESGALEKARDDHDTGNAGGAA